MHKLFHKMVQLCELYSVPIELKSHYTGTELFDIILELLTKMEQCGIILPPYAGPVSNGEGKNVGIQDETND